MEVDDVLVGAGQADVVYGGEGYDHIRGLGGNDNINGEAGNDVLLGGTGDDALQGGNGDDALRGDRGRDLLSGGAGDDVFSFTAVSHSGVAYALRDVIFDFQRGADKIDLADIDADVTSAGNQSFAWVAEFSGAAGELEWDRSTKGIRLNGDVDGDGGADFSIEVRTDADRVYGSDLLF
jgi:Ca2+-binding RTX toxin-like protein